jgi:hypothetical protein
VAYLKRQRKKHKEDEPAGLDAPMWEEPEDTIKRQTQEEKSRLLKEALNPFWASRMTRS